MQCENCQKNIATIHLTEIVNGQRSEMHLCENCASEQGIVIKSQIPINELLSSLLASQPPPEQLLTDTEQQRICPNCGFTLEQFRKEAVLGCPADYQVFEKALLPLIRKAHDGQTVHCGKVPSKMPKDTKRQIKLANLRQQLDSAVQREDYERAGELRDKINQIEKQD